jgi:hypothetical protein
MASVLRIFFYPYGLSTPYHLPASCRHIPDWLSQPRHPAGRSSESEEDAFQPLPSP